LAQKSITQLPITSAGGFFMFEWTRLATFMLAAGLLIVVPGPAVLYVVARSIDQGKLAGIVSVLGIALGAMVHSLAAVVGITAVSGSKTK
jgi:threonine/homoserine/homoserine lactone efflux protein